MHLKILKKTLSDSSVDVSEPSTSKRRKVCSQPKWRKKDEFDDVLPSVPPNKICDQHPELIILSCLQLWRELFTDEMFTLILNQTNLFATRDKNDRTFLTDVDEIGKFLGILIHSG